jgi:hypothetical protein
MPAYERGDMWDVFGKTDLFLITTNPIRKKDGAVVMGRGIALQMKERFPDLPYAFGKRLSLLDELFGQHKCFVDSIGNYENQLVGFFMVKNHWRDAADPRVIEESVWELQQWIGDEVFHRVDLNFPGIGNGKLKREDVLPLLEPLPNCVHIWEYGE